MSKSGLFFIGIYGPCVIFTHPNLQRYYTLNIHMIFHPPAWMLKNRRLQEREAPRYVAKKKYIDIWKNRTTWKLMRGSELIFLGRLRETSARLTPKNVPNGGFRLISAN